MRAVSVIFVKFCGAYASSRLKNLTRKIDGDRHEAKASNTEYEFISCIHCVFNIIHITVMSLSESFKYLI